MAVVQELSWASGAVPFGDHIKVYLWTLTDADLTGDPLTVPAHADKTVQMYGTFQGGSLIVEGANHPTSPTYTTLTDQAGNNLSKTGAAIAFVLQNPLLVRPRLSGAGLNASVSVVLCVRF